MTSKLIIKPRRSGKTTELSAKFAADSTGIYVVFSEATRQTKRREYPSAANDIITAEDMIASSRHNDGRSMMYLDEYFKFPAHVKKAFFNAHLLKPIRFMAIGTPTTQYNRKDIADVSTWWHLMKARQATNILKSEKEMLELYGEDLMFNLIVAPGVEVETPEENQLKKRMSKEQYEMEVLGNIFKGE